MPLRRAGPHACFLGGAMGPGSAAHRHSASKTRVNALMAKSYALRCVRGTQSDSHPRRSPMTKVLVLYYSAYGHIEAMAKAVADGAREAGAHVDIKRVPELVPADVAKASHYKLDQQ